MLNTLLNLGIKATSAKTLADNFGGQPEAEFLAGLEEIAFALAFKKQRSLFTPTAVPWDEIYKTTYLNGHAGAIDQGYTDALQQFAPDVQIAIGDAVDVRRNELLQFQAQVSTGQGHKRKTSEYRRILQNLGYSFKYNQCTCEIEVNGGRISDEIAAEIRCKLRDAGVWEVNVAEDVYTTLAYENRYHPIRKYLTALKFDGGDPIGDLAQFFKSDDGMFGQWIRRWLIGSVARVFNHAQNRMLILDGAQGIGKDYFVEWLCPLKQFFNASGILPDDKDYRLRRLKVWVWDVNEFGNTVRRADREAFKAFITDSDVIERRAYGKYDITGKAISSFIGTVNNEMGVLNDPTGNRRFIVTHISALDWNYADKVDVRQVWAQAMQLFLDGETGELNQAEREIVAEMNEQYQMVDIVAETVKKFFDIDPVEIWWMSTVDIIEVLKDTNRGNLKAGSEITAQKLSSALTHLNLGKPRLHKVRGTPMRGYFGIKLKPTIP
jgi:predicted P-loop ATPase